MVGAVIVVVVVVARLTLMLLFLEEDGFQSLVINVAEAFLGSVKVRSQHNVPIPCAFSSSHPSDKPAKLDDLGLVSILHSLHDPISVISRRRGH